MYSPIASLLLSGLLLAPATVPGTAPSSGPSTAPSAEITALIAQLSSDDLAARDAAERGILDVGEGALPALHTARESARDPDTQLRLDTLLVQVQERADVGGSRVTFVCNDMPLDGVLDALGKQAHAQLGGDLIGEFGTRESLPKVTLDLHDVSLWQALREIQDTANVLFFPQPDGWRCAHNFGQPSQIRGDEAGAFLVQPIRLSYTRNIAYTQNVGPNGEQFSLQFQILCEPKVRLAAGVGMMQLEHAIDSNGNDLLTTPRVQQISTGNGQSAITCAVQLHYPKNPGDSITEMRGSLRILMARKTQQIVSDDLTTKTKLEANIDDMTIRVACVPVGPGENPRGTVALAISINGGDLAAMGRIQQNLQQQIHITDSRGALLRLSNFVQTRSDQRGSDFRITLMANQPQLSTGPYKLRIDVPTSFRELQVPFVMHDLKMP